MKQALGRHLRRVAQRDFDRMTLTRPNTRSIVTESKALLFIGGHDLLQLCKVEGNVVLAALEEKLFDIGPAAFIQLQGDTLWLMTKYKAQKFTGVSALFIGHNECSVRRQQTTKAVEEDDHEEEKIAQRNRWPAVADSTESTCGAPLFSKLIRDSLEEAERPWPFQDPNPPFLWDALHSATGTCKRARDGGHGVRIATPDDCVCERGSENHRLA